MKTKSLILIFFLMAGLSTFAGKPASVSIHEKLIQSVVYPTIAVNAGIEGTVDVTFIVNDEGDIVIKNINSTNQELEKYVRAKIATVKCDDINCGYNEHFNVKFIFKLS